MAKTPKPSGVSPGTDPVQLSPVTDPKPKPQTKGDLSKPVQMSIPELTGFYGTKLADPLGGVSRTGMTDTVKANIGRALPGVDRYGEAAANQTWYEQLGIKTANMLVNIPAGALEAAGYIYELGEGAVTGKWDFNNGYIEALNQMKDPFGDVLRENPGAVFDMGDAAWWIDHGGGLVESVAQFYIPGRIIGTAAKLGAGTISSALRLGEMGTKIASAAAQGLTATSLGYIEGAMSGRDIYKAKYATGYMKEYNRLTKSGVPPEEAKVIANATATELASHAAATTVLTNTMLTSALNYTSLGAIFKGHEDDIFGWIRKNGQRLPDEGYSAWRTRLLGEAKTNTQLAKLLQPRVIGTKLAQESAQEGLEEVINHFSEQSGMRDDGSSRSVWGSSFGAKNMGNFFNDAFTQEGALNFMLGAIGGVGNTVVMENIPFKRDIVYDDNGNPVTETTAPGRNSGPEGIVFNPSQEAGGPDTGERKFKTKLYSARTHSASNNKVYYANAIEALSKDLQFIQDNSAAMTKAAMSGDKAKAEQLRMKLANIGHFTAIYKGLGRVWQNEYSKWGAADNKNTLEGTVQPQLDAANERVSQAEELFNAQSASGNIDPETNKELAAARQEQAGIQKEYDRLSQTTEAMEMGLAKDMNDNRYKEDSKKMVKNLAKWDDRYFQLKSKYSSLDEEGSNIAEAIFHREITLETDKEILARERKEIAQLEQDRDPELLNSPGIRATVQLGEHVAKLTALDNDVKALDAAIKSKNVSVIDQLANKYAVLSNDTVDGRSAKLKEVIGNIRKRAQNDYDISIDAIDTTIEGFADEFKKWKDAQQTEGPVSLDDMREKFNEIYNNNKSIDQEVLNRRLFTKSLEIEIEAQEMAYKESISQAGVNKLIKWAKNSQQRAMDDIGREQARFNEYNRIRKANQKAAELVAERWADKYRIEINATIKNCYLALNELDERERTLLELDDVRRLSEGVEKQLGEIANARTLVLVQLNEYEDYLKKLEDVTASTIASATEDATTDDDHITPDDGTPASREELVEDTGENILDNEEEGEVLPADTEVDQEGELGDQEVHFTEPEEVGTTGEGFDAGGIPVASTERTEDNPTITESETTPVSAMEMLRSEIEGLSTPPVEQASAQGVVTMNEATKEAAIQDIESRRQAELEEIRKVTTVRIDTYEGLNDIDEREVYQVRVDGSGKQHVFTKSTKTISGDERWVRIGSEFESGVPIANVLGGLLYGDIELIESEDVQASSLNKVNAKYDAEIAALDAQAESMWQISQEIKDLYESTPEMNSIGTIEQYAAYNDAMVTATEPGSAEDMVAFKEWAVVNGMYGIPATRQIVDAPTVSSTAIVEKPFLLETELEKIRAKDPTTVDEIEKIIADNLVKKGTVNRDIFLHLVRDGKMPKNLPGAIIARMQAAIDALPEAGIEETTEVSLFSDVNPTFAETTEEDELDGAETTEDTSIESEPDSIPTILFNPMPSYNAFLNSPLMARHTGLRAINGVKAIGLDQEYREGQVQYATGTVYKRVSMNEISKSDQAEKRMSPNFFKRGQVAVLIVDEHYAGPQNIDSDLGNVKDPNNPDKYIRKEDHVEFSEFLTDGKLDLSDKNAIANFPIKIQDEKGNQAGYLPRANWAKAKNPNSVDFKNIADTYHDGKDLVTDNAELQYDRLMLLREQIAKNYNAGGEGRERVYSEFQEKGPGQKIDNMVETAKGIWAEKVAESCTKLLPDESLEFGQVIKGEFRLAHDTPVDASKLTQAALIQIEKGYYGYGQLAALVPMANGQYDLALMNAKKLNEADVNSVIRLLELALMPDTKTNSQRTAEIEAIREATGHDIGTYKGLKSLINSQFTYTQPIRSDRTVSLNKKIQFLLEIVEVPEGGVEIRYGKEGTGFAPVTITPRALVDGKLPPSAESDIRKGLASRLKAAPIRGKYTDKGLNDKSEYNTTHYFPTSGKWITNVNSPGNAPYKTFNDYVRSITTTTTNGTNKNSAGEYVYAVHPQIPIRASVDPRRNTVTTAKPGTPESTATATGLPEVTPPTDHLEDTAYTLNPMEYAPTTVQALNPALGTIERAMPLTIENLQRILNFTPVENRNEESPETVLDRLGKKGISAIARGHNPFYICK